MIIQIQEVKKILRDTDRIVVLTGAGISAESGIPTFRSNNGLWEKFNLEELATPQGFYKNPRKVWQWYNERRKNILSALPNKAHYKLAELESKKNFFYIITQNIDGLHQKAGSKRVIEFHGNIFREKCTKCLYKTYNEKIYEELPPICPKCNNLLRPDVVWFGENIPEDVYVQSYEIVEKAEVLLYIGTSAVVYPAAHFIEQSIYRGKIVIEVNLEKTQYSDLVKFSLIGRASEIIESITNI